MYEMADEPKTEVAKAPTTGSAAAKSQTVGDNGGKAVDAKAEEAKAVEQPTETTPVTGTDGVPMKGENGEDLGFTLDTAGGAGQDASVADIAASIKGWSSLKVDGEPYEYSEANALALLQRYPHFVDQLR